MTADDFRAMALAQERAVEAAHMNHPDFRVAGKIFATLGSPDREWGMVQLAPEQQQALIATAPEAIKPATGAWGRNGSTLVLLAKAPKRTVRAALGQAAEKARAKGKGAKTLKERFGSRP